MNNFEDYKYNTNNLFAFYSKVKDGNMSLKFGDEDVVHKNREKYFSSINIDIQNTCNLHTQNSDIILEFVDKKPNSDIIGDAVITNAVNYFVYLAFGDCIPFILFDSDKKIMGFAHLGWQSICKRLHIKLLDQMRQKYSCDIKNMIALLGPSIRAKSYIFNNPAQLYMEGWEGFLNKVSDCYHVDLVGYILKDLQLEIFDDSRIFLSEVDTGSDIDFFSHYRSVHDENYLEGRFIFGVGIVDNVDSNVN